jgi:hypothetical protein
MQRVDQVMPSATPTDDEVRIWQALPRDEQLRRLRAALTHPHCTAVTTASIDEILAEARARSDSRAELPPMSDSETIVLWRPVGLS